MQEAALDPDYESLSWSDSDDYDQYVNEELTDSRSAKWVALVSRLAGCSLEGKTVLDLGCGPGRLVQKAPRCMASIPPITCWRAHVRMPKSAALTL